MTERELELTDLLTSARCIAQRKGESTAWERFDERLAKADIGSVTANVFKVLPSDFEEHIAGSNKGGCPDPNNPAVQEYIKQFSEQPVGEKPASERAAGHLAYLENLDELRQQAGITAAMLRDGRAKRMVEQFRESSILLDDLRAAWRHAVRVYNIHENLGNKDTKISGILCHLSQELEFAEAMRDDSFDECHIPGGHYVVEDADGERLVKKSRAET